MFFTIDKMLSSKISAFMVFGQFCLMSALMGFVMSQESLSETSVKAISLIAEQRDFEMETIHAGNLELNRFSSDLQEPIRFPERLREMLKVTWSRDKRSVKQTGPDKPIRRKGANLQHKNKIVKPERSGSRKSSTLQVKHLMAHMDEAADDALLCPIWPNNPRTIVNCSNGRRAGSTCWVTCPPGYKLTSKNKNRRKCRAPRTKSKTASQPFWSGRDEHFICESACRSLRSPANGQVSCHLGSSSDLSTLTSRTCQVTCNPGYVIRNPGWRHCQSNGTWSGAAASCHYLGPNLPVNYQFMRHQELRCGSVHSLTTYTRHSMPYLVAADQAGDVVRVYKWLGGGFVDEPWQVIHHKHPLTVQVLPIDPGSLWLFVSNESMSTLYRLNTGNKFVYSRTISSVSMAPNKGANRRDGIHLTSVGGEIYRCTGQNRKNRSVVMVQKLRNGLGKKNVFKRVARRKMRLDERIYQCALITLEQQLFILITLNRIDGRGKIVVAQPQRKKMKIVQVLRENDLRNISDVSSFRTSDNRQYLVAAQRTENGQCFVYRRTGRLSGS